MNKTNKRSFEKGSQELLIRSLNTNDIPRFVVLLKKYGVFGLMVLAVVLLLSGGMSKLSAASTANVSERIHSIFSFVQRNPTNGGANIEVQKLPATGDIPLPIVKTFDPPASITNGIVSKALNSHSVVTTSKSSSKASNTKCISNAPNGAKPHITKQGNVIIGSDCDITIHGDNQGDIIFTGNGNDVVFGGTGNDIIYAGSGTDRIYGGGGKDMLVAGSGTDLLDGGPGDDVLIGGTGNDLLIGGPGNDKLFAGTGTTVMDGGPGADHFDCGTSTTAKAVVMDYNPVDGDTISGNCKLVNSPSSSP